MTRTATRRKFLRSSAALAATTLPNWFLDRCWAEPEPEGPKSKNDTPGIALVGCGGMGRGDLKNAARFGRVVALCDVDEGHVAAAGKDWPAANLLCIVAGGGTREPARLDVGELDRLGLRSSATQIGK